MKVINISLKELVPYENNPRQNKKAVDYVANSIKEFGFKVPIVIDCNNVIVCGHTRYLASKKLKLKEVPCVVADDLSEEQIKAYRLADNKVAEFSEWDFDMLSDELSFIDNIEMSDFGFSFDFSTDEEEIQEEVEEDEVSEVEEDEIIAKTGDVWVLGEHRVMCGDSTNKDHLQTLLGGQIADLVFTDPPYGMKKEKDGILNDNLNYDDLLSFNKKWIPLSFEFLKENGSWYCWGIDEPLMDIYCFILKPMMRANKITFRNLITWNKNSAIGRLSDEMRKYPVADEKCLFVMCGVQGFNTNSDNYYEGWEPIRLYLLNEWRKISDKNDWDKYLGNYMGKHYFTKSQWDIPTKEQYEKLQAIGREHGAFNKDYGAFKREYEDIKREYEDIKREYYASRAYFDNTHDNMMNVWNFDRTSQEERKDAGNHATPKPIALCARAIKSSSRKGEIVLDVFGGSGSTLIACEQLGRKCYTMELEPKYVDVIIKRWEKATNQKAILLGGDKK